MLPPGFAPFIDRAPFCVMTRGVIEFLFKPERLDALFRDVAQRQYERELLFSELVELMLAVIFRVEPSVHAAYKAREETLSVSDQAIYDKLRNLDLTVSAALVADSAVQVEPVLTQLGGRQEPWLPGYRTRLVDGTHLATTEGRIKELRQTWAAALPGKLLVVLDQETQLVDQVFLTPDGHAQERSLLPAWLATVREHDLVIADRNFCTFETMSGLDQVGAGFIIRQHGTVKGTLVAERREVGRGSTGMVDEGAMEFTHRGRTTRLRRVTVMLDKPTTDGDLEIHILTNLPESAADAIQVAELDRRRWTIEGRFYKVTQTMNCEPQTLAYPPAALFAFCLALFASNAVALIKASVRAEHGDEVLETLSNYYVSEEVRKVYLGMMIALPAESWACFSAMEASEFASVMRSIIKGLKIRRYQKAKRGPKKKPPPKTPYENGTHLSTYHLLKERTR